MAINMKNKIMITAILLLAAVLYIIGPESIFKVCEAGDKPMKCHWSVQAETGAAILMLGIAAVYALTKTARERGLLSILAILNSVVVILIPAVLIGGCGMKTMPCRSSTFPAYYVIALAVILVGTVNLLFLYKKSRGNA